MDANLTEISPVSARFYRSALTHVKNLRGIARICHLGDIALHGRLLD